MEENPIKSNPKDFQVVEFFNSTDFDFTPELGAMYDSRPLFVGSGEKRQFPYHIGHRLAVNLAKAVLIKGAPNHNPGDNNPVGAPLWSDEKVKSLEDSFITELYTDAKPIAQTETDRLMQRVAELEKLMTGKKEEVKTAVPVSELTPKESLQGDNTQKVYQDKAEVILELEKRQIKFDRRQSKENLLKLLT